MSGSKEYSSPIEGRFSNDSSEGSKEDAKDVSGEIFSTTSTPLSFAFVFSAVRFFSCSFSHVIAFQVP
jgi:hypothetical protein